MWRYWTAADGLPETFTGALTVTPNGQVWARHGAVSFMSVLDGYSVVRVPEARDYARDDPSSRRIYASSDGTPWTATETGLAEFVNGKWIVRYRAEAEQPVLAAIPAGRRVLALFAGALREYDPATGAWADVTATKNSRILPFNRMVTGWGSDIWVSGEHGLGRLTVKPGTAAYEWEEVNGAPANLRSFHFPLPGRPGELFAQAGMQHGQATVAGSHPQVSLAILAERRDMIVRQAVGFAEMAGLAVTPAIETVAVADKPGGGILMVRSGVGMAALSALRDRAASPAEVDTCFRRERLMPAAGTSLRVVQCCASRGGAG